MTMTTRLPRALAGVAPGTRRSGKKKSVVRARVAPQIDDLVKASYAALRARGKSHG
jgi:hypothetical protein